MAHLFTYTYMVKLDTSPKRASSEVSATNTRTIKAPEMMSTLVPLSYAH